MGGNKYGFGFLVLTFSVFISNHKEKILQTKEGRKKANYV